MAGRDRLEQFVSAVLVSAGYDVRYDEQLDIYAATDLVALRGNEAVRVQVTRQSLPDCLTIPRSGGRSKLADFRHRAQVKCLVEYRASLPGHRWREVFVCVSVRDDALTDALAADLLSALDGALREWSDVLLYYDRAHRRFLAASLESALQAAADF